MLSKMVVILLLISICTCAPVATTNLSTCREDRAALISDCIANLHRELVELSAKHVQLSGIDRVVSTSNEMLFNNAVVFAEKKGPPIYQQSNATYIRLIVRDVGVKEEEDSFTQSELYCGPETGISYWWSFFTNPAGENASEFKDEVNRIRKHCLTDLINRLKSK